MKSWMIVLSSAVVAIAAAAGAALPELSLTPHVGIVPGLRALAPILVVTVLAGYALCAILLTAASLVGSCVLLRYRLARIPAHRGPGDPGWTVAFEASGLRRLAPALAISPLRPGRADRTVLVRSRFRPEEARREMARLYQLWAARTHFCSALIVLAAAAALGLAQQHGALPDPFGPVPTVPAALILVGLILLAALGRLAVDVAVEPLIELLSRLPTEPVGIALLRRAIELLEAGPGAKLVQDDSAIASAPQIPERMVGVLEEGRRALLEAVEHLSATTDRLALTTRSAIEGLEAAVRDSEQRPSAAAESAILDADGLSRLHDAIVALTVALERVPILAPGPPVAESATGHDLPVRGREAEPHFAEELKKLLAEIGTAP
ncbi:MAG: hypothetical protein ACREE9_08830 [Stellaceae bacterium]